jgi:hypothetical protein
MAKMIHPGSFGADLPDGAAAPVERRLLEATS